MDLSLTHPVTFIVAPNGVGKSSLVEAVRWALLGTPSDRDRGRAVRGGHDSASAELTLSILGTPDLELSRTLRRNGSSTFTAAVGDTPLTEPEYLDTMRRAWRADPSLLDAIVFGPTVTSKLTGFPIRDHLASVFGIDPLLHASAELRTRRERITKQIKSARDDLSGTDQAISAATNTVAELRDALTDLDSERESMNAELAAKEAAAAQAQVWQQYRSAAEEYSTRVDALVAEMADTVVVTDEDPHRVVAVFKQRAAAEVELSISAAAAAEIRVARAASATELLSTATDQCPTCLRPLAEHDRNVALASHGAEADDARSSAAQHELHTNHARQRLAAISRFSEALARLRAPIEPSQPDPGPTAIDDLQRARQRTSELSERYGGFRARLRAAEDELMKLNAAAASQAELIQMARQDLLLEVTQKSIARITDRYLTERIEPLANQIGHRWKLLFGTDGLRFAADGRLSLGHGEIDLELSDLSGGERSTALLVTRLMLAASATKASTLWLDEPLEHLDPARRATVAQTVVRAAQSGAIEQIVVTTYEEGLARRLEATAPEVVALTYARSTTPNAPE